MKGFILQLVVVAGIVCTSSRALAQGGPPLITNDPDTPGDGNWEINLAAAGAHADSGWDLAAPDLDINYGWGDRIQLSLHVPWNHQRMHGQSWRSGAGPVELAVRWRFLDEEKSGLSMAIQPHWETSWSNGAVRRGLSPANDDFALPLQVARHFGDAIAGLEVVRHFVEHEGDAWQAGMFWSRDCPKGIQCLAEINTEWPADSPAESILNIGARKNVSEHLVLLGSIGRQVSGTPERSQFLFYFGVQLLR